MKQGYAIIICICLAVTAWQLNEIRLILGNVPECEILLHQDD